MFKRIFLVVLDSLGVGEASDASEYGDIGSNTLKHIIDNKNYNLNLVEKLGFLNLVGKNHENIRGICMKAKPSSEGKDSLNGHYEIMGINTSTPFHTYPDGFPLELISELQKRIGREVIGNVAASGTEIIKELGEMHIKTGAIIVYTSADSVLQIAAHEEVVPLEELYKICEIARELTTEERFKVGRIIARPFVGKPGSFVRTPNRHDYSIDPPLNCLDLLAKENIDTISIGKISDLFNGKSINVKIKTTSNIDGLLKLIDFAKGNFKGLCFANLNDFDSLYGHRRDKEGYLKCLEEFNYYLPILLKNLKIDDLLIFTADHGNDPTFPGTDHTRENVPIVMYSPKFKKGTVLPDRDSFADISATILDNFNIPNTLNYGKSIFDEFRKNN